MKNLNEIMEDLVTYCTLNGTPNPDITLKLPKTVLENYSKSYRPVEKIVLAPNTNTAVISSYHAQGGGTITLKS